MLVSSSEPMYILSLAAGISPSLIWEILGVQLVFNYGHSPFLRTDGDYQGLVL